MCPIPCLWKSLSFRSLEKSGAKSVGILLLIPSSSLIPLTLRKNKKYLFIFQKSVITVKNLSITIYKTNIGIIFIITTGNASLFPP